MVRAWNDLAKPAGPDTQWLVKDGVLHSGKNRGTWLVSEATYADFIFDFEIKLGENSGMMNLCIPSRVLKLIRNKFDQQWHMQRDRSIDGEATKVRDLLQNAQVSLSGEIREGHMTAGQLVALGVGDVVLLDHQAGEPILLIGAARRLLANLAAS